jgi:hypothetical protein
MPDQSSAAGERPLQKALMGFPKVGGEVLCYRYGMVPSPGNNPTTRSIAQERAHAGHQHFKADARGLASRARSGRHPRASRGRCPRMPQSGARLRVLCSNEWGLDCGMATTQTGEYRAGIISKIDEHSGR